MAVNRNDAQKIIEKYFRLPTIHPGGRKYYFPINEVNSSNLTEVHLELYQSGSKITREEIVTFINQDEWTEKEPFIHLPLDYVLPGEVIASEMDLNGERIIVTTVKLSDTYYLSSFGGLINVPKHCVCEEHAASPFLSEGETISISLMKPSKTFRLIDLVYLTEQYAETKPENALNLYNLLADLFRSNEIASQWNAIINMASESGISLFTVFKILEIFLTSKTE